MTMIQAIVIWNIFEAVVLGAFVAHYLISSSKWKSAALSWMSKSNDEEKKAKLWQRVAGGSGSNLLHRKQGYMCYAQGCKTVVLNDNNGPVSCVPLSFQIAGTWYTFCPEHGTQFMRLREELPSALKEFYAASKAYPPNPQHVETSRRRLLNLRRLEFTLCGSPQTPIC
jgi:hypothetical protein